MTEPAIDALIAAFYGAFDNRGGRAPGGEALRAMFAPGATITRVAAGQAECWTPDAFIAPRMAILTDGSLIDFHEWETQARTEVRGDIASRWSRYGKAGRRHGAAFEGGGEKFIQLCRLEERWLISAILWQDD